MEIVTIKVKLQDRKKLQSEDLSRLNSKGGFWSTGWVLASNYPRFFILAMKYLCLMASRSLSERFFFYKKKEQTDPEHKMIILPSPLKVCCVAFLVAERLNIWSCLSVCPSVCLSVRLSTVFVPDFYIRLCDSCLIQACLSIKINIWT